MHVSQTTNDIRINKNETEMSKATTATRFTTVPTRNESFVYERLFCLIDVMLSYRRYYNSRSYTFLLSFYDLLSPDNYV